MDVMGRGATIREYTVRMKKTSIFTGKGFSSVSIGVRLATPRGYRDATIVPEHSLEGDNSHCIVKCKKP